MANSSNADPLTPNLLFDSDVLINWLILEEDPLTHEKLWKAPHKIIRMIDDGSVNGTSTIFNIMEVRSVLKRKKKFGDNEINTAIDTMTKGIRITVPDEINLLRADDLQENNTSLTPIDAVLLAVAMSTRDVTLITRDRALIKIASKFLSTGTPEEFLSKFKIK